MGWFWSKISHSNWPRGNQHVFSVKSYNWATRWPGSKLPPVQTEMIFGLNVWTYFRDENRTDQYPFFIDSPDCATITQLRVGFGWKMHILLRQNWIRHLNFVPVGPVSCHAKTPPDDRFRHIPYIFSLLTSYKWNDLYINQYGVRTVKTIRNNRPEL